MVRAPAKAKKKAPAAKRRTSAKPKAPLIRGLDFHVAKHYHELPSGDGILRVEPGHYVVTTTEGVSVMPPERFAEAYPEHAG